MGGTIGQFGFARSALVTMPPVQEELKLTAEQKEKLRDWQENLRKRGEEMGRGFRNRPPGGEAGEGANGNPDGEAMNRPGDVPIAARIFQFTQMLNQVGAMVRENEDGLARILKTSQRKRLDQISLQMEGAAAVVRPEVAQAINLGEDQAEMIQQILAQSRLTQMASWVEQGRAMSELAQRRRPGAPGRPENGPQPAEGQEPGQSPPAEPGVRGESGPPGEPNAEPGPRRPRRDPEMEKAFRKQFETMRERGDAIQSRTTQAILKVLTRRQRASLDRLLGPPFDPAKVNNLGPPGARPAPKTDADR
ncbi:MAG: hypothetical protein U0835_16260 [Isosphaeraceae bacterium]